MPPIDAEQHLKFLLSCIKHASAGKVNFDAVAQELGIVSKAAAAKRYERLLKAHDINPANIPKGGEASGATPGKKTPSKRKRNEAPPMKDEDDESEEMPMMAKKEKKTAVKKGKKGENDKTDDCGGRSLYEIPEFPRHLLAGEGQREGDGDDEEEVVYLGQSIGNRLGGEEMGVKTETARNGGNIGGNNGWNIANPSFDFQQPSSAPPLTMKRSTTGERSSIMTMRERSNPPVSSSAYYGGAQAANVVEGGYGGGGSSSTSAAAQVMGDVDLQQIYRQQFGDQSYEQNHWGN